MTPKSAKAKGRRLAAEVALQVREAFDLPEEDVRVTPAGVTGSDLTLSTDALRVWPFDVESKNTERLDIWDALRQVEKRAGNGQRPLVVFSRNHAGIYAALKFEDLLWLVSEASQSW